jgi:hypothetical protein
MLRAFVLCCVAVLLLAGCAVPAADSGLAFAPQPCDDGGDGGVIIDGVCL